MCSLNQTLCAPSQPFSLKVAAKIDKLVLKSASLISWSGALLMAVIIVNVVSRYFFNRGLIVFEEIQWHLYAVGFMFGLAYAETTNSQVRVDVVASKMSAKTIAIWEVFGALFFVFPIVFVVVFNSVDYVESAYRLNESSSSPMGLPYRWIIKAVIPMSFTLFGLSVCSRVIKNIHFLKTGERHGV